MLDEKVKETVYHSFMDSFDTFEMGDDDYIHGTFKEYELQIVMELFSLVLDSELHKSGKGFGEIAWTEWHVELMSHITFEWKKVWRKHFQKKFNDDKRRVVKSMK